MNVSSEFILQIVVYAIGIGVIYGTVKSELKAIKASNETNHAQTKESIKGLKEQTQKDFERLEKKQDKYNNLQERVAITEASTKSAHHRIDDHMKMETIENVN